MNENTSTQQKQQVQRSITEFTVPQDSDWLIPKKRRKRRKKKPVCLEQNPESDLTPTEPIVSNKKRTPPSIEGQKNTKRALLLDLSTDSEVSIPVNYSTPTSDTTYQSADLSDTQLSSSMAGGTSDPGLTNTNEIIQMENRLLEKLNKLFSDKVTPLSDSMSSMQNSVDTLVVSQKAWENHQNEFTKLKANNLVLEEKINKLESANTQLDHRLKIVEQHLGGCNIIIRGLAELQWEKESITMERAVDVISEVIDAKSYELRLSKVKSMDIVAVKRLGSWNKFKGRPVLVTFRRKTDAEFVINNRKYLPKKVFADYEYDAATTRSRNLLRPILNKARKLEDYKGKCRLDGAHLVLHSKHYTVDTLDSLPEDLNSQRLTSEKSENALGFFGELNYFSNFHACKFEHEGATYHSAEQFIQREKALYFKNASIAEQLLSTTTPLQCKELSKNIVNFDHEKWLNHAKIACEPGIFHKFSQNEHLKDALLNTGDLTLVESSYDKHWGTGIPLHDYRCLISSRWHTQGLLGIMLQHVRTRLKLENQPPSTPTSENMETNAAIT